MPTIPTDTPNAARHQDQFSAAEVAESILRIMPDLEYTSHEMSREVRFPTIYERVSPVRSLEEIEREMDRRCGYPTVDYVATVKIVDPRAGSSWERKQKPHQPLPGKQSKQTCRHRHGTVGAGRGREKCRACDTIRKIGAKWKQSTTQRTN